MSYASRGRLYRHGPQGWTVIEDNLMAEVVPGVSRPFKIGRYHLGQVREPTAMLLLSCQLPGDRCLVFKVGGYEAAWAAREAGPWGRYPESPAIVGPPKNPESAPAQEYHEPASLGSVYRYGAIIFHQEGKRQVIDHRDLTAEMLPLARERVVGFFCRLPWKRSLSFAFFPKDLLEVAAQAEALRRGKHYVPGLGLFSPAVSVSRPVPKERLERMAKSSMEKGPESPPPR